MVIVNNTILPLDDKTAYDPRIVARANNTAITDRTTDEYSLLYPRNSVDNGAPVVRTTLAVSIQPPRTPALVDLLIEQGIVATTSQQYYTRTAMLPGHNGTLPTLYGAANGVLPGMRWFGLDHMKNYAAWVRSLS